MLVVVLAVKCIFMYFFYLSVNYVVKLFLLDCFPSSGYYVSAEGLALGEWQLVLPAAGVLLLCKLLHCQ